MIFVRNASKKKKKKSIESQPVTSVAKHDLGWVKREAVKQVEKGVIGPFTAGHQPSYIESKKRILEGAGLRSQSLAVRSFNAIIIARGLWGTVSSTVRSHFRSWIARFVS